MKSNIIAMVLCAIVGSATALAATIPNDSTQYDKPRKSRLTLGGYGEAVASRMFYSNNYKRYTDASMYKDAKGFGQFDLPHVVFFVGYDFGKGWSIGTEI